MVDCAAASFSQTSSPSYILQPYISHPEDATHFSNKFQFSTENNGIRKVTSDAFMAGGYNWAIDFYPNGTRLEDDQYISLFVTLESNTTDVIARFELILVDQSGKGKHKIQTNFGVDSPCLMKHQGSQWGFRRFIKKSHLKKLYLKDGLLVVKCRVGVLDPVLEDQGEYLEPVYSPVSFDQVEELEDYSFEEGESSLLDSAVKILFETDLGAFFSEERDKFDQYMHAVDEIQESIKLRNISDYKIRGVNLIQMAMERLLLEFRNILDWSMNMLEDENLNLCCTDCSSCIATSCSQDLLEGDYIGRGALSSKQIYRLRCMSERLNCAGRLQECVDVYNNSRKSVVDASFSRFGIGNWVDCDIRSLDWDEFAKKIKFWIRAAQMCFVIIIPREKQTYEQIFNGLEDVPSKSGFLVIVEDFAIQLCNFAEIISNSPALLQKLFDVLELYKFLLLYLPDIRATFHSAGTKFLPAQAKRTVQRLADLARQILSSFEDTVLHDQLNTTISRGTLHSSTRDDWRGIPNKIEQRCDGGSRKLSGILGQSLVLFPR
ncbi:exocyst complex component EXO70B2-like isoform X2 [Apium graveolens]|uniref:exocyst complex component EXO70B2-like isoform X2 n=1 Tax=Apium graveolens TaxID=4045 RepID=UPI003D7A8E4B